MARGKYRMWGGALASVCPTGFYCMDTSVLLFSIFIILLVVTAIVFIAKQTGFLQNFNIMPQPQKPTIVILDQKIPPTPLVQMNSDPRFAPMAPERAFGTIPDLRGYPTRAGLGAVPINAQTRGIPETYQQIGVITAPGGTSMSATPNRTILPLFGRALDSARNKWNYYTRTDGMNPVQVPVQFKKRNCDDEYGCDEILDGDSVGVPIMGESFTANIYKYSTPRYIPY
jgi:hypothetical protein